MAPHGDAGTLGAAVRRYGRVLEGTLARTSVMAYRGKLAWATRTLGEQTPLDAVGLADLEDLLAAYRAGRSANTASHFVTVVRGFFTWCVEVELLERSPAARWRGPSRTKPNPRGLSEAALRELLAHLKTAAATGCWREVRNEALVWTLVCAGLRREEAATLTWRDVDLPGAQLSVLGKGTKRRTIPIYSRLLPRLERLYALCGTPDGAVFPKAATGGAGLHPYTINVIFARYIVGRLGFAVSPHDLRHTFAQLLMEEGAGLEEVQDLLGHENIATTRIYYGKTSQKKLRKAVERLPLKDL